MSTSRAFILCDTKSKKLLLTWLAQSDVETKKTQIKNKNKKGRKQKEDINKKT